MTKTGSTPKRSVAAQFRSFRRSKKMTQAMLALCLGISRRSVIYIEMGAKQPTVEHMREFEELVKRHRENA